MTQGCRRHFRASFAGTGTEKGAQWASAPPHRAPFFPLGAVDTNIKQNTLP